MTGNEDALIYYEDQLKKPISHEPTNLDIIHVLDKPANVKNCFVRGNNGVPRNIVIQYIKDQGIPNAEDFAKACDYKYGLVKLECLKYKWSGHFPKKSITANELAKAILAGNGLQYVLDYKGSAFSLFMALKDSRLSKVVCQLDHMIRTGELDEQLAIRRLACY